MMLTLIAKIYMVILHYSDTMKLLRLFIARGAYLYVRNNLNETPETIQFLIDCGLDVNNIARFGVTPLMTASSTEVIEALLSNGADPTIVDTRHRTMLHHAAANGYPDIQWFGTHNFDLNIQDREGRTPLVIAIHNNKIDTIEGLLKYGANFNIPDKEGLIPLVTAIKNRNFNVTEKLLEYGANLDLPDKEGHTPREIIHKMKNKEFLSLLDRFTLHITKGAKKY